MSNQHKIKPRWLIGFAVGGTVALLLLAYGAAIPSKEFQTTSTIQASQPTSSTIAPEEYVYGLPMRLKIPKIGINAEIQYMGMMADGNMESPNGPAEVGWYKRGPRPGEKGSSVVAGHYGWFNDQPAAFDNLHKLTKGDRLSVVDDQGNSITFVVRGSRSYSPDDDTADIFAQNDGGSHLNLITCEGTWDRTQQVYLKRLVVFTDRVTDAS